LRDIQNGNTSAWQFAEEMQLTGIKGAFIAGVYRGSPADSAGLVAGDYVTAVASTQIGSAAQLTETIASLSAGTKTDFTVLRLGKTKNLLVTIGQRDAGDAVVRPENLWPGITVEDLTTEIRGKGQIPPTVGGVVVASVTDARSPGARAGLKPGDLIIGANGVNIETIMDFYRALDTADGKNTTLAVFRAGSEITVGLQ
jgi:serine protease Do